MIIRSRGTDGPGGAVGARHDAVADSGISNGHEEPVAERDANPEIIHYQGRAGPGDAVGARHDIAIRIAHGDEDPVAVSDGCPQRLWYGTAGPDFRDAPDL